MTRVTGPAARQPWSAPPRVPPPQGPRRPGQTFDEWLLAGMLIEAENERDRITEAAWRQKQDSAPEPSPYLAAALRAQLRTRASIEDRARSVALGVCSLEMASCFICSECPEHHEQMIEDLRREVALYRAAVARQENLIRWAIRPLIADRAAGVRIIAAAENISGPLPRRRILEFCRHAAAGALRRHVAHAGR